MSDRDAADHNLRGADVSASEAANYTFCAKAWHLEHVLRVAPSAATDQRRIAGIEAHVKHGADIQLANRANVWLVRALVALLLVAVAVFVLGVRASHR